MFRARRWVCVLHNATVYKNNSTIARVCPAFVLVISVCVVHGAITLVQQPIVLLRVLGAVVLLPTECVAAVQLHVVGVNCGGHCLANASHTRFEDIHTRARGVERRLSKMFILMYEAWNLVLCCIFTNASLPQPSFHMVCHVHVLHCWSFQESLLA